MLVSCVTNGTLNSLVTIIVSIIILFTVPVGVCILFMHAMQVRIMPSAYVLSHKLCALINYN